MVGSPPYGFLWATLMLSKTSWAGHIDIFKTCIQEVKVDGLRYSSMHYTQTNQCPENLIMRKLDIVLVNEKWSLNFPLSEARLFPFGVSDHSPMVVKVVGDDQNIKKPFKFFDMWWIMMSSCSGEESLGLEFGGLSNVSVVLQTQKAKASIETFQ